MKFRTDFVTNSSSSSFIAFKIMNKTLFNYLISLKFQIESGEDGLIDNSTIITLPSGLRAKFDKEAAKICSVKSSQSVSEWLVELLMQFVWLDDGENGDETDLVDYDDILGEKWEEFHCEMEKVFKPKIMKKIRTMDGDIEYAHISLEQGFEDSIYVSEEINIDNGKRIVRTPEKSLYFCRSMDDFNFSGTPGEVITQKWENGCWVTQS